MKKTLAPALVVCLPLIASQEGSTGQEKVELKLKLKTGDSFLMEIRTDTAITKQMMGREEEFKSSVGMKISYTVEDVDAEGVMQWKIKYVAIAMKSESAMGGFEYDSEKPSEGEIPLPARPMAAMVGKEVTVRITDKGRIKEVKGIGALNQSILESIEVPEEAKEMVAKTVKDMFGEEAIKEEMENAFAHYPDKPVGVGDSWAGKVVTTRMMPMIMMNTLKLKERKEGRSMVDVKSEIRPNPDAPPTEAGPMAIRVELRGTQEGTLEIDESTGWIVSARFQTKLSGKTTFGEGDHSMDTKTEGTFTIKQIK